MRLAFVGSAILGIVSALATWRLLDHRADKVEMRRLLALQPQTPQKFDRAMVADLPEPARRYFMFSIAQGTPLLPVAEFRMSGQFSLGDKNRPNYLMINAHQVLAAPNGFVWKMRTQPSHLRLSGSDSAAWTRFWMGGIVPVARGGGDADHARAAFGRYGAEAIFWTPAAVLPGPNVSWTALDTDTAKMTMRHSGMEQTVHVKVAQDGQPTEVTFPRWSNANPDNIYQLQTFGGYLSKYKEVQGYHIPTHVEAGNFFGSDAYFPFYKIDIGAFDFPER